MNDAARDDRGDPAPRVGRRRAARWSETDRAIEVVELPVLGLPHDVIDPDQPTGDVDTVHPILVALLTGDTQPS